MTTIRRCDEPGCGVEVVGHVLPFGWCSIPRYEDRRGMALLVEVRHRCPKCEQKRCEEVASGLGRK